MFHLPPHPVSLLASSVQPMQSSEPLSEAAITVAELRARERHQGHRTVNWQRTGLGTWDTAGQDAVVADAMAANWKPNSAVLMPDSYGTLCGDALRLTPGLAGGSDLSS